MARYFAIDGRKLIVLDDYGKEHTLTIQNKIKK